jgi:hypothetical protein
MRSNGRVATLFLIALAAAAFVAPAAPAEEPAPTFSDHMRAARRALGAEDLDAARRELIALDGMTGGLPAAAWNLALIAARQGQTDEALARLEAYAAMGLVRSARSETTFAALRADPRFEAVAARLEANGAPVAAASTLHTLDDPALLAEDLAWDARTKTLFVSSIHRRKVLALDREGRARDFVAPAQDGIWGVYGLALDHARRRLWGGIAAGPNIEAYDPADSGRAAIVCWDLDDGRQLARIDLPRDGGRHVLGDLALGPEGVVYVTDSIGGALYRARFGAAAFDTILPPGTFGSPQMPVVFDDRRLFLADYPRGIVSVDLATRAVATVPKPPALAGTGIDGLYLAGNALVAIQNGTRPIRVLWLPLDARRSRITDWRVLEQGTPVLGEPNHGVRVGDALWLIGNSGWDRVNAAEELVTGPGATPPVVLRLSLPAR